MCHKLNIYYQNFLVWNCRWKFWWFFKNFNFFHNIFVNTKVFQIIKGVFCDVGGIRVLVFTNMVIRYNPIRPDYPAVCYNMDPIRPDYPAGYCNKDPIRSDYPIVCYNKDSIRPSYPFVYYNKDSIRSYLRIGSDPCYNKQYKKFNRISIHPNFLPLV